jgi:CRISPR-associated helicase Cas3/CRISPR-associated endonuclease Cas3-HD
MCQHAVYAHTKEDPATRAPLPEAAWQPLAEHLSAVAVRTREAAAQFGAGEMAHAAGLLHDIGKATDAFQRRLHGVKAAVDHKTVGGRLAVQRYGKQLGRLLAYAICGHHGGLPDGVADGSGAADDLMEMLERTDPELLCAAPETASDITPTNITKSGDSAHQAFYLTMLIRMVFSALVDADYLDTERFMTPEIAAARPKPPPLSALYTLFAPKLEALLNFPQDTSVNVARRAVLNACLAAAEKPPGFFKLTVPTGGGKTLSSLAFALEHARRHGLRRIIYAIPFTSITEQNAGEFRKIFGDALVLEHHSNVKPKEDEADEQRSRLACENWDAPLVVTTNVQLFESLFASQTSRARKVHNIAGSVIILDEAQTLPDPLLKPTLAALKSLAADFGATVVFCTATQPALKPEWLDDMPVHEIVPDVNALFTTLTRTEIHNAGELSDEALAEQLRAKHQALCIVNTRGHAKKLYQMLEGEGVYHLSAVLCPTHRTQVIDEIKARLQHSERCLVISTQLIEAGVDIDFPCVYRAAAGVDSIAQAAGRCNREGKLEDADGNAIPGAVTVFTPEQKLPQGELARLAGLGGEVMKAFANPLLPEAIEKFFRLRYGLNVDLDAKKILESIRDGKRDLAFPFREIARKYQLIDSKMISIVIPYDDTCREVLEDATKTAFRMEHLRRLQRYMVSIYRQEFQTLQARGAVQEPKEGVFVLNPLNLHDFYNSKLGLVTDAPMKNLIH